MDKKDFESLLNKYPDCVSDGKKLKAYIKDLYPDVPKAIVNTLTIMADDGIISEMQMSAESSMLVAARLQKKLEDDYGLSQKIISDCFLLLAHKNIEFSESVQDVAYDSKDFEIVKGVLKKYKGNSSVVVIPDSVTSIGHNAFYDCTGLTSVAIGNRVTSIGNHAFYNCSGLISVTIGNRVTSIGSYAFHNTAWYNNQPDGLVYVGKVAYRYKGTMPINTSIVIKDGILGIAGDAFSYCTGLTSITIPASVTSIGDCAFYGCGGLTSITIPDSVTSIGDYAFDSCTSLTSITIPDSVTSIGNMAFFECTALTSVTIGNGVTSIGDMAFLDCSELMSVFIPNSVTSIGDYAFSGNWNSHIYCEAEAKPIGWSDSWKLGYTVYWDAKKNKIICPHSGKVEVALEEKLPKVFQDILPSTITCDKANYCNYGKCQYKPEI